MPKAGTEIAMENDHSLRVENEYFSSSIHSRSVMRIFNFKSAQVTTVYREWIADSAGNAVTSQMNVQNFSDIESPAEIRDMHAKLVELGGRPPALDDILPSSGKARVSAAGKL